MKSNLEAHHFSGVRFTNREYTIDDINNKRTVIVIRLLLLGGDYKAYMESLHEDERAAVIEKLKIIAKEIGELGCQK